jgi:hypothetical protein
VLVACEYSGTVRDAFIAAGHEAMSCDLLGTDAPGPHYQGDVRDVLDYPWDLMIAHPPCTHLSVSGSRHFERKRMQGLQQSSASFFLMLSRAAIPRIAIENPICVMSTLWRKPDQTIQPYNFGHDASKATCLWLKGLPPLRATSFVEPRWVCCDMTLPEGVGKHGCANCNGEKTARPRWANQTDSGQNKLPPSDDRWKIRSETFAGIAKAMADQWGGLQ